MTFLEYLDDFSNRVKDCMTRTLLLGSRFESGEDVGDLVEAVTVRPCDGCQHCCILPFIPGEDFEKAGFPNKDKAFTSRCQYCSDTGCSIHPNRPEACRAYTCTYRLGLTDHRPDKCGVSWAIEVTNLRSVTLVGQCLSSDSVFKSTQQLDYLFASLLLGTGVSEFEHAIVRAPGEVSRVMLHGNSLRVDRCSITGFPEKPDMSSMSTFYITSNQVQQIAKLVEQI